MVSDGGSRSFEEIHQVVLDVISDNMDSLVQSGKQDAINTADTSTHGYYVIIFISEAYTLQNNTTIDREIITTGELVVKVQYLCSIPDSNNWYWEQHPQKHAIIVPTRTILHPRLDVVGITDVQDTPKSVCNRIQAK